MRIIVRLLLGALTAVALAGAAVAEDGPPLRIGTGGTGGTYEAFGFALKEQLDARGTGLFTAELVPTRGSNDNLERLLAGEVEACFVQADGIYRATRPENPLYDQSSRLRAIGTIMPEAVQIFVRKDSGITTVRDLIGKTVAAGRGGSGSALSFRDVVLAHGYDPASVRQIYPSNKEASERLVEGTIDAWAPSYVAPWPYASAAIASGKVTLLEIERSVLAHLASISPTVRRVTIAKDSYEGIDRDIQAPAIRSVLVTTDDLDPMAVGELVRVLNEEREELANKHPWFGQYSIKEAAFDLPLPLHSAALNYYASKGVLERPVRLFTGIFCTDIGAVDIKAGTFDAMFYLWFRWQGDHVLLDENGVPLFEVTNAIAAERLDPITERRGTWRYAIYRMRATLRAHFPLHRYPFDVQRLEIHLELPDSTREDVVFLADESEAHLGPLEARSLSPDLKIADWQIHSINAFEAPFNYPTQFGSMDEDEPTAYSRFTYRVEVARVITPYIVKFVVPLVVIVLMAFGVFFINAKEFEVQAGIVITALLSCVAFHLTQADSLPEVGYLVTADKFFLLSYLVIFLALVQVIWENSFLYRGREDVARRIDKVSRWVFPALFFGPMLYLLMMA
ncbi:MAG: TAXI family TRAP transporter solute-binding subunit [Planctomycetota bacterium]|jgi:TRAP transporter TAXI family solute receptor